MADSLKGEENWIEVSLVGCVEISSKLSCIVIINWPAKFQASFKN